MAAQSFAAPPEGLERALAAARAHVARPSGGVVFVSGTLVQAAARVAEVAARAFRGVPFAVVPAAGVLTERGEIEAAPAASGLLFSGGEVRGFVAAEPDDLAAELHEASGGGGTAVVFATPGLSPDALAAAARGSPRVTIFGAGAASAEPILVGPDGPLGRGAVVGLAIRRIVPLVRWSAACRLLTELYTIDEVAGGLVLRLGGVPALDRLAACATATTHKPGVQAPHPVVLAALADADANDDHVVVRPLRGVDPDKKGIVVGPEARPGARLGFAVRDAAAARAGLEATVRQIARDATGSAPSFALHLTCAGRGQGLYGAPDVEARLLRQRFGDLPIAGMHAAFEIVPFGEGDARIATYTAVVALFRAPS
ncbi:MAG TPA: FIST C-terminal domain-containing protein [Minicystis sp.]|nr:FIST C-terminal domain-containing protein [Minicystis sp.]